MSQRSLADVLGAPEDVISTFRRTDISRGGSHMSAYQEEYTNWIEEQRAWRESCILMDQSYHLANYYIEGPDAVELNADLGINRFDDLEPDDAPRAKQHPVCSPEGYIIGDPILFYLGEEEVVVTGNRGHAQKWIHYNLENGDYDASLTDVYDPYGDTPPIDFRFEIQGPHARSILEEVIDGPFPELSFFGMDEISIEGVDLYMLGHGMASVPGYEIFGPYEHHEEFKNLILGAGEEYGIRELGSKAYKTATLTTGWLPPGLPAIYDSEEMQGYREWLDADCIEANWSLGGSFTSEDITDFYLDPVELGYDRFIDMEHDFVGKDAIAAKMDDPERTKVTFVWNPDDIADVYASLFREGASHKFIKMPDIYQQWDLGHFDEIRRDGSVVGVSIFSGYDYNQREMLSLGVVDREYGEPGTEVTLVWGEEGSEKPSVERHEAAEIRATVAPAPYVTDREDL
ncbi:aminomethyl transferase family protein [Halobellus sp. GM3]